MPLKVSGVLTLPVHVVFTSLLAGGNANIGGGPPLDGPRVSPPSRDRDRDRNGDAPRRSSRSRSPGRNGDDRR